MDRYKILSKAILGNGAAKILLNNSDTHTYVLTDVYSNQFRKVTIIFFVIWFELIIDCRDGSLQEY